MDKLSKVLGSAQIEKLAREEGFVQRCSKMNGVEFLKMNLFDQLGGSTASLQQHALNMFGQEVEKISKQAVDKRFNGKAVAFIKRVVEALLSHQLEFGHLSSPLSDLFKSIRILDSTEFKLSNNLADAFPGYSKSAAACAAIQFEYDILNKRLHCLSLGNARESDKTFAEQQMDNVQKGDLLLRDLGYYSIETYAKVEQQEAFYVSRLKPTIAIFEKKNGEYQSLQWSDVLARIKKRGQQYFDQWVYIGSEQKHAVRLVAWELPEAEQQKRNRRIKAKSGKINKQSNMWSKLNVFITNIATDKMDASLVYSLYKIRWQIELIFKTWKSVLKIVIAGRMKADRLKCYLYSKFIWILISWDIINIAERNSWEKERKLLSPYKCLWVILSKVGELRQCMFNKSEQLQTWLQTMRELLLLYAYKETKKTRVALSDLLQLKMN
jgi:hypothetical protein